MLSDSLNETEKHFYQIILSNNSSEELVLPDAAFWDITFDRFDQRASIRISNNAFGKAASTIKTFSSYQFLINHYTPDYDVWKVFSGLTNLNSMYACVNVTEIPSSAFLPINGLQSKLGSLSFNGKGNSLAIIRKMAFYNLPNLNRIYFEYLHLIHIESWAFASHRQSSEIFFITFYDCSFNNGSAFNTGSFDGIQRPLAIEFYYQISHFPESTFKSVLDNPLNKIYIYLATIDCTDCRNYWLIRDRKDNQFAYDINCSHSNNLKLFSDQVKYDLTYKCETDLYKKMMMTKYLTIQKNKKF